MEISVVAVLYVGITIAFFAENVSVKEIVSEREVESSGQLRRDNLFLPPLVSEGVFLFTPF